MSSSTTDVIDATRGDRQAVTRSMPSPVADPSARGRAGRARRIRRLDDPVVWVSWLFVLNFLLQRISLPGISIPLTVPITVVWLALGWKQGVLVVEPRRTWLWLVGAGVAALVAVPQILFVDQPYISVNSWAFWMVIWLPAMFMFADRSRATFERCLTAVTNIGVGLGALSLVFFLSQVAGLPYRDYLGEALPPELLVQDFAISYPIFYDSPLYKSNGWVALEPSFMSFTLGLCILAGLLSNTRVWKIAVMALGMVVTVGGSGFAIVVVGVLVMLLTRQRRLLGRYVVPAVVLGLLAAPTQVGQEILKRLTEGQDAHSSTSLRSIEPYLYLWPRWVEEAPRVFFGDGAGSSRLLVDGSGVRGLLVPTVGKVLFDYGLIAGAVLLALFFACYLRTPEPAIGLSVLASMLIIQPPAQPLMVPAFLLSTLWAPAYAWARPVGLGAEPLPPRPPGLRERFLRRRGR